MGISERILKEVKGESDDSAVETINTNLKN